MRFLLDQDVYAVTAQLLVSSGHDVTCAAELGLLEPLQVKLCESSGRAGGLPFESATTGKAGGLKR